MPHSLTFNAIVREEQLGGNNTSIAVAVVWAAQGRQSRHREEGSRGGARKAVAAAWGRQSRRRGEGSRGGIDAREIDAVLKYIQNGLPGNGGGAAGGGTGVAEAEK